MRVLPHLAAVALALALAGCAGPARAAQPARRVDCPWGCWFGPVEAHPHPGPFGEQAA